MHHVGIAGEQRCDAIEVDRFAKVGQPLDLASTTHDLVASFAGERDRALERLSRQRERMRERPKTLGGVGAAQTFDMRHRFMDGLRRRVECDRELAVLGRVESHRESRERTDVDIVIVGMERGVRRELSRFERNAGCSASRLGEQSLEQRGRALEVSGDAGELLEQQRVLAT
jgi:hypothetical protein